MKTILCYGDSNTWGYIPLKQTRYNREERWTGVLRKELKGECEIIEEGLCGRTTVWDDSIEGDYKNGKKYITPCIESHSPIDVVIILLGTNDLKNRFGVSARDIAQGAGTLVEIVNRSETGPNNKSPKVLLVSPPILGNETKNDWGFEGGREKSLNFAFEFKKVAEYNNCYFLDASKIVVSSEKDGVHLEIMEHEKLGKAVAEKVKQILQSLD